MTGEGVREQLKELDESLDDLVGPMRPAKS